MRKLLKIRHWVQLTFFIISSFLFYLFISNTLLIIHKFCPYSLICFGTISLKQGFYLYPLSFLIFAILTALVAWFGRFFCGFICFLGTYQEYLYKLIHRETRHFIKIDHKKEIVFGSLKYIIFLATIILTFMGLSRIFMGFCPIVAIGWIKSAGFASIIILAIITVAGALIERFWCRFLCPYAALMNITSYLGKILRIQPFYIQITKSTCLNCGLCNKACPMNIDLTKDPIIKNPNCIKCMRCIEECPTKDAINWR